MVAEEEAQEVDKDNQVSLYQLQSRGSTILPIQEPILLTLLMMAVVSEVNGRFLEEVKIQQSQYRHLR